MSSEEEPNEEEPKVKTEEPEEKDQKGTKRKKTDVNAGESEGDGETGGGGGDDDDENDSFKIKSRREANRLHALKSRQRSKQLLSDLQITVGQLKSDKQDLERQNSVLLAQVDVLQQQNYKLLQGQQMLLAQNPSMAAPSSTPSGGLSSGAYAGLQQQQPGMGGFMQQHLMGGSDSSMQGMFPGQQQLQMAQLQHFQQQQLQQQNAMMMNGQQSQNPGQSLMGMSGQQALLDRQPGSAAKES